MLQLRRLIQEPSGVRHEAVPFALTHFPDQTSQVWKIEFKEGEPLSRGPAPAYEILWLFENEGELFPLLQLTELLQKTCGAEISLNIPYLPYARQDKAVSNTSTWALHLLARLLQQSGVSRVSCYDQHSPAYFESRSPEEFHQSVFCHDLICFPDEGARRRYPHLHRHKYIQFAKTRNQLTGRIEKVTLDLLGQEIRGQRLLIVDDLCDGGGTFIQAARELHRHQPGQVDLCVSHGLFSKGTEILHEAGITELYTTNSLLRNPNGYPVWK